jgi:hypothetical protein
MKAQLPMRNYRVVIVPCLTAALLGLIAAGCGGGAGWLDRKDRADPLVRRAQARVKEGDVKAGIRLYQAALDSDPSLARAHLDLALLYHDVEHDYVRAIYHYRRYQELRGSTEKKQMIEDRIRVAGQLLVAGMQRSDGRAVDKADLEQQNQNLKSNVERLNAELEMLRSKYERLVAALRQQERGATAASGSEGLPGALPGRDVVLPESAGGRPGDRAAGGSEAASGTRAVRTYRVQVGDSLSSIARQMYEDPGQWPKIYSANKKILGNATGLKVGQVIVIP